MFFVVERDGRYECSGRENRDGANKRSNEEHYIVEGATGTSEWSIEKKRLEAGGGRERGRESQIALRR